MSFGNKHRTRGKGFKLFSDELPRIEFDKTALDEYEQSVTDRGALGRRRTIRDSGHDRMSLPSLGTPDWEMLSDFESSRPNSMQSPPFNPLNPNFAKIHQKIQRRHTLKDSKINNGSAPRRISFRDKFVNDKMRNHSKTVAWVRQNSNSLDDNDNDQAKNGIRVDKLEPSENRVIDKPPIHKKKSIFKELLEASAKENTRMNRIKEGLTMDDKLMKRSQSLRQFRASKHEPPGLMTTHQDNDGGYVDTRVPEVISHKDTHSKPGILKRGARVRDSHVLNHDIHKIESYLKPRLVHQEDLPLPKGHHPPTNDATNEVRVSVYSESPMNRVSDMQFVPLPSSKPRGKAKRVNFHHQDIIKEVTEISESDLVEHNNEQKDNTSSHERRSNPVKLRRYPTIKAPKPNASSAVNAFNTERVSKFLNVPTPIVKPPTANVEDKQNYIDTILLSSPAKSQSKDPHNDPSWKEVKSPVEEPEKSDEPVDLIAHANSPLNVPRESPVNRPGHFSPHPRPAHQLSPLGHVPESANYTPSRTPDLESLSELTAIFDDDDFDLADLPDEIDRSLLGEDLIKAYRLWDRKRKAFPGGLRKIDAPADRPQPMFPKQYGGLKTYKIPSQVDIKSGASTSKPQQKSVLVEWV